MEPVRVFLILGMVAHKLFWEMLRLRAKRARRVAPAALSMTQWLVKGSKLLVLLFLLCQTLFLELWPIAADATALRTVGILLYSFGLLTAMLGRWQLGDNWVDLEDYQVLHEQALVTHGIYRYIRHPIYTGDICLLIGLQLALNSWLVLGTLLVILVVVKQALAEDALLARSFPGYRDYCTRTRRFIPFIV